MQISRFYILTTLILLFFSIQDGQGAEVFQTNKKENKVIASFRSKWYVLKKIVFHSLPKNLTIVDENSNQALNQFTESSIIPTNFSNNPS